MEKTVDLATADIHPFAKVAKDVAAGAVLLFAIIAVIIECYYLFTVCGIVAFQSFY
ncbi:diacylglycerol kinase [Bacillus pacificus]